MTELLINQNNSGVQEYPAIKKEKGAQSDTLRIEKDSTALSELTSQTKSQNEELIRSLSESKKDQLIPLAAIDLDQQVTLEGNQEPIDSKPASKLKNFIDLIKSRETFYLAAVNFLADDVPAIVSGLFSTISQGNINLPKGIEESFKAFSKLGIKASEESITKFAASQLAKTALPKTFLKDLDKILLFKYIHLENQQALQEGLAYLKNEEVVEIRNQANSTSDIDKKQKLFDKALELERFANEFSVSNHELKQLKELKNKLLVTEGTLKGALWSSIPTLNRLFSVHVLKQKGFAGIAGAENEKPGLSLMQKLGIGFATVSGGVFNAGFNVLKEKSDGNLAKRIRYSQDFSHGVFPKKGMLAFIQMLPYEMSRLFNARDAAERNESLDLIRYFLPVAMMGERVTDFMAIKSSEKHLAKNHQAPAKLLTKVESHNDNDNLIAKVNSFFPEFKPKHRLTHELSTSDPKLKNEALKTYDKASNLSTLLHIGMAFITRFSITKNIVNKYSK
jgi:hypothetical protein